MKLAIRRRTALTYLLSSCVVAGGWSTSVLAQTAPAEVIAEGDIVVTAQKREERLQDVPAAVSVLSATTLATANQTRLRDYFDTVPSFQVSPSPGGGNQQSLAIRGVSSGAYANPTVGIMIDEVPFGAVTYDFSPEVDPSDLARIEVLRGPQGTLYGASSIGGLVKFVTLDPSTSDVSARAEAGVNTISHGDKLGYSVKGSLNLPLSSTLAVRISAFNREDPGYIDNPTTGREDVNSLRATGARFSALWNATDNISVKLNALYQRSRADGSSEEIHGFGLTDYQQNYIANTGQSGKTIQSYSAIINAGFGAVDVTSVSGYSHYKVFSVQDYTNNAPWGARAQLLFGTPGASSRFNAGVDRFTQEVRATFKTGEALDWLVGAFYSNEDTPIFQSIAAANVTTGAILGDILNFDIPFKQKEFAVFADPTLHLFDRFSIQFGARYSWLDATFDSVRQEGRLLAAPVVLPAITQKANVFTYLVTPQFKVNRDLMIYGRVATGYRPGRSNSFNPDLTVPRAADADTTTNYEIGIKGALLSNMLSFDASLYHIDWKDIQITLVSVNNGIAYTANAARAKSQGFELSSTLRPGGGLTVAGWLSFNHAVVTEGVVNAATFAPAGARLPFSTKFTANISADQKFEISGDLTGSVGITFGHTGKRFGTFIGNPNRSVYPAFNKIDLRAGLEYGPWAFNVYARNIGDTHGLLGGGAGSFPPSAFTYIQPRSIGASLSRTF